MRHGLFLMEVGKKIRMQRKAKKLTLQEMSKVVSIHITGLSFIENGKSDFHILSLKRIAECLDIDLKELL